MKKYRLKKGFSMPEVIVAIAIVVLIIVSASNLLISSLRANNTNVNQIIAYNLAQEALEGFRNIRDGYWLHNQDWRGGQEIFGSSFQSSGLFTIEKKHSSMTVGELGQCLDDPRLFNDFTRVQNHSPWQLSSINSSEDEAAKVFIIEENNIIRYSHNALLGNDSGFRRWLEIESVDYHGRDDLQIAVTAVVEWQERGNKKDVRIPTMLTNWKSGS